MFEIFKDKKIKKDNIATKHYNEYIEAGQCCNTCIHHIKYDNYGDLDLQITNECYLKMPEFNPNKIYEFKCSSYRPAKHYSNAINRVKKKKLI